jgi:hypothetical protein
MGLGGLTGGSPEKNDLFLPGAGPSATPSATPQTSHSGPNSYVWGMSDNGGTLGVDLTDPQDYFNARNINATRGRTAGEDRRNYLVGRSEQGAENLRDESWVSMDDAFKGGLRGREEALGYGQQIGSDLRTRASEVPMGNMKQLERGLDAASDGIGYGQRFDEIGSQAVAAGAAGAQDARSVVAHGTSALSGINRNELTSAAPSVFQLGADRAIQNAARTGNIAGAAGEMSDVGMSAARMRAGDEASWRNAQLSDLSRSAALRSQGQKAAAASTAGGYGVGANAVTAGAGARQTGFGQQFDANRAFADNDREARRLEAGLGLEAGAAEISAYENAADATYGAVDNEFDSLNNIHDVNNLQTKGTMGLQEDRAQRQNAWIAHLRAQKEAGEISDAAYQEAIGNVIMTGLMLL